LRLKELNSGGNTKNNIFNICYFLRLQGLNLEIFLSRKERRYTLEHIFYDLKGFHLFKSLQFK